MLCAAFLASWTQEAHGQKGERERSAAPHSAVYAELVGSAGGFSLNYDHRFSLGETGATGLQLRVGLGAAPAPGYNDDGPFELSAPLTASLSRWGVEIGAGATFTDLQKNGTFPIGFAAYRFGLGGPVFARLSVTTTRYTDAGSEGCGHYNSGCHTEWIALPGLSVGLNY